MAGISIALNQYNDDMFKKLIAALSSRRHASRPAATALPYKQEELNLMYQLLFCDDPDLVKATPVQASLFGAAPDARVVQTIGVPAAPVEDADAVVVALKSRTIAPAESSTSISSGRVSAKRRLDDISISVVNSGVCT